MLSVEGVSPTVPFTEQVEGDEVGRPLSSRLGRPRAALRQRGRPGSAGGAGDGLAVGVVDDVTGSEDAGQVRTRRGRVDRQVALVVQVAAGRRLFLS